jgi:hypothetical protein
VVEVSCDVSALTIMRLRGQENCLVSEHTYSEVTPIAHSRGNRRPRQKHECPEKPPWAKTSTAFCRSWHNFCLVRGTTWVKANDRARINRPYTFHGG